MSNDRAIAAVTSTLRTMIFRAVSADATLAGAQVTARPPDRARANGTGNQVNLFLYRTSIDAAWRNQDPPGLRPGESGQPPLPLILSYLVTTYGDNDDEILSHRLLGLAMRVLNDRPVLSAGDIAAALPGSDLEHQVERVRVTPESVSIDEITRMWTTFQTGYRISASYHAAVVLIESTRPARGPLPVLTRGLGDTGPVVIPQVGLIIDLAFGPNSQPGVRPGEDLTLVGRDLGSVTQVRLSGPRLATPMMLSPSSVRPDAVVVQLPSSAALPAGNFGLAALADDGRGDVLISNEVPVVLSPVIVSNSPLSATLANGAATLQLQCAPPVQAGQTVALIVGDRVVAGPVASPGTPPRSQLSFNLTGFTAGSYTLRLRVDNADSIPLTHADPRTFDPNQSVVLA